MSEIEELRQRLRERLDEADGLAVRYRRALRRDLLAWIIIAATLGALVGYGMAAALTPKSRRNRRRLFERVMDWNSE